LQVSIPFDNWLCVVIPLVAIKTIMELDETLMIVERVKGFWRWLI